MEYFYLYLLGQDYSSFFGLIAFMLASLIGFYTLAMSLTTDKFVGPKTWMVVLFSISLFLAAIIPSQKSLTYMGAYYVGKEAIQSEIGQKLFKVLNQKLDSELDKNLNHQ